MTPRTGRICLWSSEMYSPEIAPSASNTTAAWPEMDQAGPVLAEALKSKVWPTATVAVQEPLAADAGPESVPPHDPSAKGRPVALRVEWAPRCLNGGRARFCNAGMAMLAD